jgi:hypothetical protein
MRRKRLIHSPLPRSFLEKALETLPEPTPQHICSYIKMRYGIITSPYMVGKNLANFGFIQQVVKRGGKTQRYWFNPETQFIGPPKPPASPLKLTRDELIAKTLSDPRLTELDSTGRLLGTNSAQVRKLLQPILPPNLRIASIMKALGYLNKPTRDQGGVCRRWLK